MKRLFLLPLIVMALLATATAYDCGNPGSPTPKFWLTLNEADGVAGTTLDDVCGDNNWKRNSTTENVTSVWPGAQDLFGAQKDHFYNYSTSAMGITSTGNRSLRAMAEAPNPLPAAGRQVAIISQQDSKNEFLDIWERTDNKWRCLCGTGATTREVSSTGAMTAGAIYDIVCTYNGSGITMWLNGSYNNNVNGACAGGANGTAYIGAYNGNGDYPFTGWIDEVAYWETDLSSATQTTAQAVASLYANNYINAPAGPSTVGCTVNLETPTDNYHNNSDYNTFTGNLTCYEDMADNCTLYAWGIGSAYGTNTTLTNNSQFQITNNASWNDDTWTWQFNCTNGTQENASVQYDLIIDTVNPIALIHTPANWTSYEWATSNQVDLSCQDDWMYNMTADIYNADGTLWRTNVNNTDSYGNTTYELTYEFTSNMSIGDYWINLTCMDSHTKKKWKADEIVTGNMLFKIKKDGKWVTLDWDNASLPTYTELEDRIKWGFEATINDNGNIRETVKIKCDMPLYLLDQTNAHFVCGQNWIDFQDLTDQGYTFTYEQVNEQKWKVKIKKNNVGTPGQTIYLDPAVGGLNTGTAFANFSITYTPPVITYDNAAANYTINDLHYTNITCTNGTDVANLTNMTIAYHYPNGTLLWNYTWDIAHNKTATRTTRVPLNLSQGGTGFYIETTCYDNNTNYTTSAYNYSMTGANSVTAWDNANGSIVPNWNATIGAQSYWGGATEDWFNDSTLDTYRWTNRHVASVSAGAGTTEAGETAVTTAYRDDVLAARAASANLTSQQSFKGRDIHLASKLHVLTDGGGVAVNASLYITDNSSNFYYFDSLSGTSEGNWTFWTLNYSDPNITFYRDGLLADSLDVSTWDNVYIAAGATAPADGAAGYSEANITLDWVAAPEAWVETSTWGAGVNTLTTTDTIWGHVPTSHQIDTLADYFNNTNITLFRSGIYVNAYDEQTIAQLTYNVTFANTTTSYTVLNQATYLWYSFNASGWPGFPEGNLTVTVSATGYASRTYYATVNPLYSYTQVIAYLLASGQGVWSTFFVVTADWTAIPNATLNFTSNNGTTDVLIGQGQTDSFGSIQIYLDPLKTYTYTCEASGYTTETGLVTPIATTYYIIMGTSGSAINYSATGDYFWHTVYPPASMVSMTEIIEFRINDPYTALAWFQLSIINASMNTIWSMNQTTTEGGIAQINLTNIYGEGNLTNDQAFYAEWRYQRYGINYSGNRTYYPKINYTEVTAPSFMRAMASMQDQLSNSPSPALAMISAFAIAVGAGLIGGAIGFGGGFVVIAIGFFLAYMDFIPWQVFTIAAIMAFMAFLTIGRRYG